MFMWYFIYSVYLIWIIWIYISIFGVILVKFFLDCSVSILIFLITCASSLRFSITTFKPSKWRWIRAARTIRCFTSMRYNWRPRNPRYPLLILVSIITRNWINGIPSVFTLFGQINTNPFRCVFEKVGLDLTILLSWCLQVLWIQFIFFI